MALDLGSKEHAKKNSNLIMEKPDRNYLSQVVKVNNSSHKSC